MIEKEITLESGGTTYVLAASLDALRKIAQRWDKMETAINDLRGLNFEACVCIVGAAAGLKADQAEKAVFAAGLARSTQACVEYLAFLINPEGEPQEDAKPGNL